MKTAPSNEALYFFCRDIFLKTSQLLVSYIRNLLNVAIGKRKKEGNAFLRKKTEENKNDVCRWKKYSFFREVEMRMGIV